MRAVSFVSWPNACNSHPLQVHLPRVGGRRLNCLHQSFSRTQDVLITLSHTIEHDQEHDQEGSDPYRPRRSRPTSVAQQVPSQQIAEARDGRRMRGGRRSPCDGTRGEARRRRVEIQVQQRRDGVRLRRRRRRGPVGRRLARDGGEAGAVRDAAVCQVPAAEKRAL
jgi:hypothetical protein